MTAVVAFHLGDVVVMAADTRETDSAGVFRDGIQKIVCRPWDGATTGTGLVELLEDVKTWFSKDNNPRPINILGKVEEAALQARSKYYSGPHYDEVVRSFQTTDLLVASTFSEELRLLRINAANLEVYEKPTKPSVTVLRPPKLDSSILNVIETRAQRKLNTIVHETTSETRLTLALEEASLSVALFSARSVYVSPTVSCAFVKASGETGLHPIRDWSGELSRFDWDRMELKV